MNNLYYMIWADAILSFRKHNPKNRDWKLGLIILITWMNALNLWIIFLWLKYFNIFTIPNYNIDILPGELLDNLLVFSMQFALPFMVLNYFLVFYNNRYEEIIKKYKNIKVRYAQIYSYTMLILALVSAFAYGMLTE